MKKSFILEDFKGPSVGAHYSPPAQPTRAGTGFWYKFCTLFPQYKSFLKKPSDITRIITTYNNNMREACINNRAGVEFPEGLGVLFIGAYKTSKNINFGESVKLGKKIHHRNLHTGGLAACIYYDTSNCNYIHNECWDFYAERTFKKIASDAFKNNWNLYLRLETISKAIFNRRRSFLRNYAIKKQNELLKDYNEFYIS